MWCFGHVFLGVEKYATIFNFIYFRLFFLVSYVLPDGPTTRVAVTS
jgi:hypothetical protein